MQSDTNMIDPINSHGDHLVAASASFGSDIASQRVDDLDALTVWEIESRGGRPTMALDLACGLGAQARRMALAGARVVAVDQIDTPRELIDLPSVRYVQDDMRKVARWGWFCGAPIDIVSCQRALHYLPMSEACVLLRDLRAFAQRECLLHVSFSGIESELSVGYAVKDQPVDRRLGLLSDQMAKRHGILAPVCLYRAGEAVSMVEEAGWSVRRVWHSPFGNVKLCAVNDPRR